MQDKIKQIQEEIRAFTVDNDEELENFRLKYLSRKGMIQELFKEFKDIPAEQKKEVGKALNTLKEEARQKFDALKKELATKRTEDVDIDMTLPGYGRRLGSRHPISVVRREVTEIFKRLGYTVSEARELEDDWHVFSALNFPPEHPARDMQDTFFINKKEEVLLRTHTSSVQVRVMESQKPPIRTIAPGRVYRNEAISARAHAMFHQIEGIYIDKDVSFADLKQSLIYFARELFGPNTQIRLRPSYFPFTEPSAEMDISCSLCGGKGCNVCKYTGWLEVLGCGMMDPNVLEASNIDSEEYTGFAFGMGLERIAMLKYNIKDLRLYFENDQRFLGQFYSAI